MMWERFLMAASQAHPDTVLLQRAEAFSRPGWPWRQLSAAQEGASWNVPHLKKRGRAAQREGGVNEENNGRT